MRRTICTVIAIIIVMSLSAVTAFAANPVGTPKIKASSVYNCKIYVSWTKASGATYYELFSNGEVIAVTKNLSYSAAHFAKEKVYSFKVRGFYIKEGKRVYGNFSNYATVKTRYRVPRLVLVEKDLSHNTHTARYFRQAGYNVTMTNKLSEANPKKYDGLILPGGVNDITPSLYGQKRHSASTSPNYSEDKLQINAVRKFAKAKKPVLGICRGHQIINVAFGGTLRQNLILSKGYATYEKGMHKITTVKGSWISSIYGSTTRLYFYHHQAVGTLGEGLVATSWSTGYSDRFPQSIEHKTLPIYGVQWHPDSKKDSQRGKLMNAFKKVVIANMGN